MKLFSRGDTVYVVEERYLVEESDQLNADEAFSGTFDRIERGLAYIRDRFGLTWEIPARAICGVPEGHVFAATLGSTSTPNPCLVCGCEILVPYRGLQGESEDNA